MITVHQTRTRTGIQLQIRIPISHRETITISDQITVGAGIPIHGAVNTVHILVVEADKEIEAESEAKIVAVAMNEIVIDGEESGARNSGDPAAANPENAQSGEDAAA